MVSSLAMERIIRTERPDLHEVLCRPFPTSDMSTKETTCPTASSRSSRERTFRLFLSQGAIDRRTRMTNAPAFRLFRENPDFLDSVRERESIRPDSHSTRRTAFLNNWTLFTAELLLRFLETGKTQAFPSGLVSVPNSRPWTNPFGQISGQPKQGRLRGGMLPLG